MNRKYPYAIQSYMNKLCSPKKKNNTGLNNNMFTKLCLTTVREQ